MKSKSKKALLFGVGGTLLAAATGFQLTRIFVESPGYEVLEEHGDIEIRRYAPRLVAETYVDTNDQREATNEGFRRLADYIFGGNRSIAMTTPVEAEASDARGYRVAFTMPSEYTLASIPKPASDRVQLRQLDAKTVAALRFSGSVSESERKHMEKKLLSQLSGLEYTAVGEPWLARYDPPMWVLPFFRRNEVLVEVR